MKNNKITNYIYAAGLFDGEGTVTMTRSRKSDKWRRPKVSLASTSKELVSFMKDNFGGSISNKKTYQVHHKQSYSWAITDQKAISFLKMIKPYLKECEKIRRANHIINNYNKVTQRNGKYTEEMTIAKTLFEIQFFHLSAP